MKMEWLPIETAPKDGTNIIVFYEAGSVNFCHIAFYDSGDGTPEYEEYVGWWSYVENCVGQEKLCEHSEPTHWIPLPNDPKDIK